MKAHGIHQGRESYAASIRPRDESEGPVEPSKKRKVDPAEPKAKPGSSSGSESGQVKDEEDFHLDSGPFASGHLVKDERGPAGAGMMGAPVPTQPTTAANMTYAELGTYPGYFGRHASPVGFDFPFQHVGPNGSFEEPVPMFASQSPSTGFFHCSAAPRGSSMRVAEQGRPEDIGYFPRAGVQEEQGQVELLND